MRRCWASRTRWRRRPARSWPPMRSIITDGRARGLSEALLDRLLLNEVRIAALAADTRHVATLPDPVGERV